jgi:HSP20 family protein
MYRRTRLPSIWREMDRLQHEMNRLFDATIHGRVPGAPAYPAVNIWANEDGQIVTAEMPGVNPDDIELNVSADTLTLSGERTSQPIGDDVQVHRAERAFGKFVRKIQLPFMVDPQKVKASFTDGVLQINLPRAEADKPKKISVKSS